MLRFFEEMVIFLKALGHRNSRALFDPKNRKKVIDFCEDKLISAKKYPISIDYDEEKNEEVVFDVVHKECNFPAVIEHGVFNLDLELFNPFEGRPTTEDVLSHMEENRLRPATFHEFKVFIRTYPEIKKKEFMVVALGSVINCYKHPCVPVSYYLSKSGYHLDNYLFDYPWPESTATKFLAVRKETF